MTENKDRNRFLEPVSGDELSNDLDHTKEARIFYAEYWGKTLSDSVLDYDGSVGNYRGETIFSFNTIAGCMIWLTDFDGRMPPTGTLDCQEKRLDIIKEYAPDNISEQFEKFHGIYHTLANFMPLIRGEVHLNLVKGGRPYHDFPDLFLKDLRNRMPEKVFCDKINNAYFSRYVSWDEFIKRNYIQDFFTDDTFMEVLQLAPSDDVGMPYSYAMKIKDDDEKKEKCIGCIESFLTNATKIIEKRAERLRNAEPSIVRNKAFDRW